jgi:hypothetical protein
MQTLSELGPAKLLDSEQHRIRYAADNLIFSADLREDGAAREALEDVEGLCRALVECGRWTEPTAQCLADDVAGCGPVQLIELQAA